MSIEKELPSMAHECVEKSISLYLIYSSLSILSTKSFWYFCRKASYSAISFSNVICKYVLVCKDNASERNVSLLTNCRVQLILCKDNASERNVSLLTNCRVQLIFCKDNANERNVSLLTNCRVQLIFCKDKTIISNLPS